MYVPGSKNQHVDSAFTVWKLTQLRNVFLVTFELLVYVSCRLELQSETLKKGTAQSTVIFHGRKGRSSSLPAILSWRKKQLP